MPRLPALTPKKLLTCLNNAASSSIIRPEAILFFIIRKLRGELLSLTTPRIYQKEPCFQFSNKLGLIKTNYNF
ncbi:MAG: hypothetical protein A3B95_01430 [Candidatus Doudnabacteria bacterium RIFCSPHIGHO2_02_FULL_43_13b]|nr:MAG: hypothetical protein A3B95_01430 [Candidatus Doudnabacteria bacterium RIFCSPHIGHO2_02_FULL_43_13b]